VRRRSGFALLASLWLVVTIAALSVELSWLARTRRLHTVNALDADQSRAAAESGLEHARGRLLRALASARNDALADPWRQSTGMDSATLDQARYVFDARDDAARLDVNRATETMLVRLFAACGADNADASVAAARIADWRDPDTMSRASGAERDDYLAAGARVLPRDGDVQDVDELDGVLGLPTAAWSCVRPLLSVRGAGMVNPNTAPAAVLQALPGFSAEAALAVVAVRRGQRLYDWRDVLAAVPAGYRSSLETQSAALQRLLVYQTSAVRITSVGLVEGSPVQVRAEALLRRSGPTAFVEWRSFR
jgi:general secretion pathway protein K